MPITSGTKSLSVATFGNSVKCKNSTIQRWYFTIYFAHNNINKTYAYYLVYTKHWIQSTIIGSSYRNVLTKINFTFFALQMRRENAAWWIEYLKGAVLQNSSETLHLTFYICYIWQRSCACATISTWKNPLGNSYNPFYTNSVKAGKLVLGYDWIFLVWLATLLW